MLELLIASKVHNISVTGLRLTKFLLIVM